jgi:Tfp pilus assembly protein PilF
MLGLQKRSNDKKPAASSSSPQNTDGKAANSLLSTTLLAALLIGAAAAGTLITALLLRHYDYKQQIIINDFLVPAAGSSAETSGDFGKEVSDLFANDLNDVIQQGSGSFGDPYGNRKSKISQPFDGIPKIPVSKSYGIEIQGISIDQILKAWDAFRYDQQLISGDIILASGSPNRYMVQISLRSDNSARHWKSDPFLASQKDLFAAVQGLAEDFVKSTNPEIAGRYYLASKQYSRAVPVFTGWMKFHPDLPEPSLYLAKTLIMEGEYGRATVFAKKALDLAPRTARKNRQQLETDSELAQATAAWGAGDPNAEKLFSQPLLRKLPYAMTNLGLLYLEKTRYADAEGVLRQALGKDGGNFGAAMALGETYAAEKNNSAAIDAFRSALQISPTSAEAADSYLDALHTANRDPEAAQYCDSWVGTNTEADAIVSDVSRDLYLLCAQAEASAKKDTNPSQQAALAWYYAEALARPEGDEAPANLFSDMVDSMPEVLCQGTNGKPSAQLAAARSTLTTLLRKRARDDQRAAALVKDCEGSGTRGSVADAGVRPTIGRR